MLVDAAKIYVLLEVRLSQEYMKYLFHHAPPLPPLNLVDGLEFGELRPEDMDLVIATSSIRRHRDSLLSRKNAAYYLWSLEIKEFLLRGHLSVSTGH